MKQLIFSTSLILGLTLSAHSDSLGEHTINRQGTADFSLSRTLPNRNEAKDITVASCIALPDSWAIPSNVVIAGKAQSSFSVAATRNSDGETQITSFQALQDYTWYCYQDTQRNYAESDNATLTFSLNTEDSSATIFSSVGTLEGIPFGRNSVGDYYYQSITSHQIIRDTQAADYYSNLTEGLKSSELISDDFNPSSSNYNVVQVANTTYFLNGNGQSFSIDGKNNFKSYSTPSSSRVFYINDQFIFLISEGNPSLLDTRIQFGSDLSSLSEVFDIKQVGHASALAFDASKNQYVILNTGTSNTATKAYYTSPDLQTWTANTVGLWQNSDLVFASDGRGVMKNLSLVDSLMSRTANGDWQGFAHYPSDQYFSARDLLFSHDRFYILLTERDKNDSGSVLSSRIGYSDDLNIWNWTTLTTKADEIASIQSLVELGTNQVGIINGNNFWLSSDKGETWGSSISPLPALLLDAKVDNSALTTQILSLTSINNTLVGTTQVSTSNNKLSNVIFSTLNGSEFKQIHRTENPQVFSLNDDVYFYESDGTNWGIYKATAADKAPATEPKPGVNPASNKKSSGGSLFWFISLFATLAAFRNRNLIKA